MNFKIGENIGFLLEKGGGTIIKIEGPNNIIVLDDSGFERPFFINEIVKIHSVDYKLDNFNKEVNDDESISTSNFVALKENLNGNKRSSTVWEIDLHIEELLDTHVGLSNTEILIKQMNEFRSFFRRAQEKSIVKLIVIHGVGEGVLKNEIRSFLSKKDNIEFFDASYMEYGKGATEIRLFHSNK
jgi:DNA-nicking Smr family endonuclease